MSNGRLLLQVLRRPGTPGALCVTRQTDVYKVGAKLGIDSMDVLGKVMPTKAVIRDLHAS
jgi:hypothetical protein